MALFKDGTITIIEGSEVVTGEGTSFTKAAVGMAFTLPGIVGAWQVSQIISDTQLRLNKPFEHLAAGEVYAGLSYFISSDFTPIYQLPYHNRGDRDTATLLKRALEIVDKTVDPATLGP